ncbi:nicotinate-nucleotide diphosphorylase [Moorella sulfitireducens]|uniref:nicotinate-nucleotide diphosphorylase n=1 Tax=Neomoorella sulfitireducens TaxID=2972948 RepID=UPI0021ACAD35|nr:nicotinate-nucleotide pyrophosphorylase [Moorella sulfitireducens]
MPVELREFLFASLEGHTLVFAITARERGIFSGAARLQELAGELGLKVTWIAPEGYALETGSCVFRGRGGAQEIVRAEEMLLGVIGKPSGVATAAANFVRQAGGRIKVVCGAWKKVAPEIRDELRRAIATGGAGIRITERPFIYLDKNYVRLLGGVEPAVSRARAYDPERVIAVQVRGEGWPIAGEAEAAVRAGAGIIMVDTGLLEDLATVVTAAQQGGWREKVKLAFAGGVTPAGLEEVIAAGADIVDVGRAIIDAPLLDLSLDVEGISV